MKVYFCPDCGSRFYILPENQEGDKTRCLNCGKIFPVDFTNCVEEFEQDKYPDNWQK